MPRVLLDQGVQDVVRISDARMSGTSFGTVVLHVAPESAIGGPLAAVQTGDEVELEWRAGSRPCMFRTTIALRLRGADGNPPPTTTAAMAGCSCEHVNQADEGCDFDFLRKDQYGSPVNIRYCLSLRVFGERMNSARVVSSRLKSAKLSSLRPPELYAGCADKREVLGTH